MGRGLHGLRNVRPRFDEKAARNADNPFLGSAARIGGEIRLSFGGDVLPDDGKVTILEFKEIRAATAACTGARAAFWSRSETSKFHDN